MFNDFHHQDSLLGSANGSIQAPEAAVGAPVLIIGGGPSGLLQSYLLSRLGVRTLVVERYPERLGAPKAHALSPRSLEICRQFGLDTAAIRNLGTKREDAYWVNFLTSLSGEALGVLPYERMDPGVLNDTPEMIHNIPQPTFEQFVADALAKEPCADICKGVSFVSLEQDEGGVTTTVEERATGHTYRIKSQYVIACDGARSKVRDFLEIETDGESSCKSRGRRSHVFADTATDETMMTIHFNANLRPIVGKRVGMLHWLFDPIASGFIIAYDLTDNAVLISNFDSSKYPVESWSEELCQSVLQGALGKDVSPQILSYRPWLLSRKVANEYRCGNVFLAGDAAHSFPPTGGLGLNSGIADVHNLAFKIASVWHGQASSSILDTYEAERRHVAEVNSRQSVKNGKQIFGLLKTLGTAGISDLQEARKALFASIHDPSKTAQIKQGVEQQREHFDNLNLHIGYVYGDTSIPEHASHFTAQYIPGARLPHAWVRILDPSSTIRRRLPALDVSYVHELSPSEIAARRYSTLDLCEPDAFTFLLPGDVQTNGEDGRRLSEVVTPALQHFSSSSLRIHMRRLQEDFTLDEDDPHSAAWLERSGFKSGGGLLVRPDQHILLSLRAETEATEIIGALECFLGR